MAQPDDALSVIGYFLTLVGLLGSFFYMHLGDWYRQVLALEVKWEINRTGDDPELRTGRRECRHEAAHIAGWSILATSLSVSSFMLLISILALVLWFRRADRTEAWTFIGIAGLAFLILYVTMTAYFLIQGYSKARRIRGEIDALAHLVRSPH